MKKKIPIRKLLSYYLFTYIYRVTSVISDVFNNQLLVVISWSISSNYPYEWRFYWSTTCGDYSYILDYLWKYKYKVTTVFISDVFNEQLPVVTSWSIPSNCPYVRHFIDRLLVVTTHIDWLLLPVAFTKKYEKDKTLALMCKKIIWLSTHDWLLCK